MEITSINNRYMKDGRFIRSSTSGYSNPVSNDILDNPFSRLNNIPQQVREFIPEAPLKQYLILKLDDMNISDRNDFYLNEILTYLKDIMSKERLYDPNNTSLVLCDKSLEKALDMKALHLCQVRDVVCKQLVIKTIQPDTLRFLTNPVESNKPRTIYTVEYNGASKDKATTSSDTTNNSQYPGMQKLPYIAPEKKFCVRPDFLAVIRTLEKVDKNQTVFEYQELSKLLTSYILKNKKKLFDDRNIKVVLCEGDLLGRAFGIKGFYRSQVMAFLRTQLIEVPEIIQVGQPQYRQPMQIDCDASSVSGASSVSSESGAYSRVGHSSSAAVKNLSDRINGLSTSNYDQRIIRKRANDDSDEAMESLDANDNKRIRVGESSGEESIEPEQGYETAVVQDEEDEKSEFEVSEEEAESGDDEDEQVYTEYEVDSDDYGPVNHEGNSDSNEDSDVPILKEPISIIVRQESNEGNHADTQPIPNIESNKVKNGDAAWKCYKCKKESIELPFGLCKTCYKDKKAWMPERPQRKSKSKKNKVTKGQSTKSSNKKETEGLAKTECNSGKIESGSIFHDSGISSCSEHSGKKMMEKKLESNITIKDIMDWIILKPVKQQDALQIKTIDQLKKMYMNEQPYEFEEETDNDKLCNFCLTREKTAGLVHGKVVHQVSCYPCAKKLYKQRQPCPICRRRIEKIVEVHIS